MEKIKRIGVLAASFFVFSVVLAGQTYADTDITISGNGSHSDNEVRIEEHESHRVEQSNNSNISNNVSVSSNTGNNHANYNTGGDTHVSSGDVSNEVRITNTAGFNSYNGDSHDNYDQYDRRKDDHKQYEYTDKHDDDQKDEHHSYDSKDYAVRDSDYFHKDDHKNYDDKKSDERHDYISHDKKDEGNQHDYKKYDSKDDKRDHHEKEYDNHDRQDDYNKKDHDDKDKHHTYDLVSYHDKDKDHYDRDKDKKHEDGEKHEYDKKHDGRDYKDDNDHKFVYVESCEDRWFKDHAVYRSDERPDDFYAHFIAKKLAYWEYLKTHAKDEYNRMRDECYPDEDHKKFVVSYDYDKYDFDHKKIDLDKHDKKHEKKDDYSYNRSHKDDYKKYESRKYNHAKKQYAVYASKSSDHKYEAKYVKRDDKHDKRQVHDICSQGNYERSKNYTSSAYIWKPDYGHVNKRDVKNFLPAKKFEYSKNHFQYNRT